jgi:hypothetical protein
MPTVLSMIEEQIANLYKVRQILTEDMPAKKHRKVSKAGRARIANAQRKRWAKPVKKSLTKKGTK